MAHKRASWRYLADMDVDLALLQETCRPPADVAARIEIDPAPWINPGPGRRGAAWRTAIASVSGRVKVEWQESGLIASAAYGEFAVSAPGTLTAARITPPGGNPFVAVSMCAEWESPHVAEGSRWIYADASAHRIVSDLSVFVGRQRGHRILAAGDLNILRGYGEHGSGYWAARYDTVFSRMQVVNPAVPARGREGTNDPLQQKIKELRVCSMEAIGLPFVGPETPYGIRPSERRFP